MQLPHNPVIFLGIYPREVKTSVHSKTYAQMFIVDLFVIPPKLEMGEWLNNLQYIHTTAIKRRKLVTHVTTG